MSPDLLERRACKDLSPSVFYPTSHGAAGTTERIRVRRTWCAHCPVAIDCRAEAFAQEHPDYRYGVRGNMTATERTRYWDKYRAAERKDLNA